MATRRDLLAAKIFADLPRGRHMAAVQKQRRERAGENLGENAVILEMTERNLGAFLQTCSIRQLRALGEIALGLGEDDLD